MGGFDAENWIDLGDIGWTTENGLLFIAGRTTDGRIAARQVSQAVEVEHALWLDWRVTDVAAIEVDGTVAGKPGVLVAVSGRSRGEQQPLPAALHIAGLADRIMVFDMPRIPRGPSGKVDRPALRGLLQAAAVQTAVG